MKVFFTLQLTLFCSLVSCVVLNAPDNATFKWPLRTYYCPYDVSGHLAEDFSSLAITYSSPKVEKSLFRGEAACFVQLRYSFLDWNNTFIIKEIEYTGDLSDATATSKTVLHGHYGPMYWTPVSLSAQSRVATNASRTQYAPLGIGDISIRTIFMASALDVAPVLNSDLTQTLKLSWLGPSKDWSMYTCEWPDNVGNVDTLKQNCRGSSPLVEDFARRDM